MLQDSTSFLKRKAESYVANLNYIVNVINNSIIALVKINLLY